jgi:hypothetical protein
VIFRSRIGSVAMKTATYASDKARLVSGVILSPSSGPRQTCPPTGYLCCWIVNNLCSTGMGGRRRVQLIRRLHR